MSSRPFGVYRRHDNGRLYFELRVGSNGFKLYSIQIESVEVGALCNDIARRYIDQLIAPGGKRKAPEKLNYPEFSAALALEVLTVEFTEENKDVIMQAVLEQARVAARAMPPMPEREHARSRAKVQKYSGQDVGSGSVDKRTSSKTVACSPSRSAKKHLDSAVDHEANDYGKRMDELCEHSQQCIAGYKLKVSERQELEQKVKDMTEDSGFISFQQHGSDQFHEHMTPLKQRLTVIKMIEQKYLLEESECVKLREKLKGHNVKSMSKSLMGGGNTMTGRRRADEEERPPPVSEMLTPEQNSGSMPTEVGALCAPPSSTPVLDHVVPENDTTVESDMSEPVDWYAFKLKNKYTDQDVDEDARPAEVGADCDAQVQYQDQWSPDWSDELFSASEV